MPFSPVRRNGVSAELAKLKNGTSKRPGGFTASAARNVDKHNTLYQRLTLALQHGMVCVGLGRAWHRASIAPGAARWHRANADLGLEGIAAGGETSRRRRELRAAYFLVMFHITGTGPGSQPETRSLR